MGTIFFILIFLILIAILIVVSTAIFIGTGYLITLILPLTLFQTSILCISATFVLAFIISTAIIGDKIFKMQEDKKYSRRDYYDDDYDDDNDYDDDDYDDEDDEDDEYDEDDKKYTNNIWNKKITPININRKKVGRNEPCPCGSGKKYKYCCGKAK